MVEPVRYRLRMPEPHTHLLHVEIEAGGVDAPLGLVMPSWTPGSYLMREFPRNVQGFAAVDGRGRPLAWEKTDKGTWVVQPPEDGGAVRATYQVYANEISVRTSHLDATHAAVNGASVFMYVAGRENGPLELAVEGAPGWRTTTALRRVERKGPAEVFAAESYDELVDSPLETGTHALAELEVEGKAHRWAVWGRGNLDLSRLVEDTRRIVLAEREIFGVLPYPDYTFLLHLVPGGYGGLEHRNSTALLADRWSFRGKEYEGFLGLVAHELFHLWNGKRIRPAVLGPFDYTRESYTRDLWVVEGFTTYYTDLVLRRAGIISEARYLERLGESVSRYLATPGRAVQTLAESSFDAWIKFYRPDANTPNAQISYYLKGSLVALLLDLGIRERSGGQRSLDDVMRVLWSRFGEPGAGFPEGEVERVASEVAGEDLAPWFDRWLRSTEELDLDAGLAAAGLRLVPGDAAEGRKGAAAVKAGETGARPDLQVGLRFKEEGGRAVVSQVLAGMPAYRAGANAGDELVALDGLRVTPQTLPARLAERRAGDRVALTVFRRDELVTLEITLEEAPPSVFRVVPVEAPSTEQEAVRADWLRAVVEG
jgi:predicted metalloprotease with PDZ domain